MVQDYQPGCDLQIWQPHIDRLVRGDNAVDRRQAQLFHGLQLVHLLWAQLSAAHQVISGAGVGDLPHLGAADFATLSSEARCGAGQPRIVFPRWLCK